MNCDNFQTWQEKDFKYRSISYRDIEVSEQDILIYASY